MAVHQLNLAVLGSDGKPGKPFALRGTTEAPEVGDRLSLNGGWHLVVDVVVASARSPDEPPVTWIYLRRLDVPRPEPTDPGAPAVGTAPSSPGQRPRRSVPAASHRPELRSPPASERVFVVQVDERDRRAWLRVVAPALPALPLTVPPTAAAQQLLQEAIAAAAAPSPSPPVASSTAAPRPLLPVLPPTRPPGPLMVPAAPTSWRPSATRAVGRLVLSAMLLVALAAFAFTATLALGKYRRGHAAPPPAAAVIRSP